MPKRSGRNERMIAISLSSPAVQTYTGARIAGAPYIVAELPVLFVYCPREVRRCSNRLSWAFYGLWEVHPRQIVIENQLHTIIATGLSAIRKRSPERLRDMALPRLAQTTVVIEETGWPVGGAGSLWPAQGWRGTQVRD